eukprot:gene4261-1972_t
MSQQVRAADTRVRMIARHIRERTGVPAAGPRVFQPCSVPFTMAPLEGAEADRPGLLVS